MLRSTVFIVAVLCGMVCSQATAVTLTVTETATGSGIFNGTPFTNALVTLTGTLNSGTFEVDNPPDGFASVKLTGNATISVLGVSDTLTGHSVNPNNGSQFNGPFELDSTSLSTNGTTFTGADIGLSAEILILSTSDMAANYATTLAGPGTYSGQAGNSVGYEFATASGGFFQLTSPPTGGTVTIAAVPEPGSLVLSCLGTVGVALLAFRKRRRVSKT
ncbi:MAG TPA: PEP-CTERM sorting domain-containing protein [Pirellulales bacterium]|jgi:hypothetical protein